MKLLKLGACTFIILKDIDKFLSEIRLIFSPAKHTESCMLLTFGFLQNAKKMASQCCFNLHFSCLMRLSIVFEYLRTIYISSSRNSLFLSFIHFLYWVSYLFLRYL